MCALPLARKALLMSSLPPSFLPSPAIWHIPPFLFSSPGLAYSPDSPDSPDLCQPSPHLCHPAAISFSLPRAREVTLADRVQGLEGCLLPKFKLAKGVKPQVRACVGQVAARSNAKLRGSRTNWTGNVGFSL
eukprot:3582354-Rhodomonas_salina.1